MTGWLVPFALAASTVPTTVGLPLGNEADPYGPAVARMVKAIVQYTRWPGDARQLDACVVGPASHADDLLVGREVRRIGVTVKQATIDTVRPAGCDIVYLGRLSVEQQRVVTDRMRGHAVLTLAENDPACRSRAMFCLLFEADALNFRLNIDAVADSKIRIDPRILRMSAGERS